MDNLRIALLIGGIVIVAGIYLYARLSRRNAAKRRGDPDSLSSESFTEDSGVEEWSTSFNPLATGDDAEGTRIAVGHLDGIFAPRRETSDVELSVDVGILAGLRASYESTVEGTLSPVSSPPYDHTMDGAEGPAEELPNERTPAGADDDGLSAPPDDSAPAAAPAGDVPASPPPSPPGPGDALEIDMSRPLVYLTLVAKDKRLPGRAILDALDSGGFLPGLMQLYYRRSDFDPTVVVGVANMVESGVLDPNALADVETPGLVTFMGVPDDPAQALKTFNSMVAASRRLAQRLEVTLCDETRSALTAQAENHMRERVGNIARRGRMED